MLRSQNPAFFIPSRYHSLPVRTIYPAKHAGIPGKVFCVRNRQVADSEKQNGKRQLLPFDLSCYRKRNPAVRRKRDCAVNLGAGLPLAGFGREKKAFREYLLRSSQPVNFKFEGISYQVTIQDVRLFPQGCSSIAVHPELIRGEPSVLGMIRCIDEAKEQVRRETGLSVTDAQVERVLAGQSCSMDENARTIIQKQGRIYTEALLSAAMEAGFDLKAVPAVMLGGGASVIQRGIRPQDGLRRVFTLLDDKVNAEGFERILGQFSGRVSKE